MVPANVACLNRLALITFLAPIRFALAKEALANVVAIKHKIKPMAVTALVVPD